MRNVGSAVGVFTRSVLSIPSVKILDKIVNLCTGGLCFTNLLTLT